MKTRALLFSLLCFCCVLTTVIVGVSTTRRSPRATPHPSSTPVPPIVLPSGSGNSLTPLESPRTESASNVVPNQRLIARTRPSVNKSGRKVLFFRANALGANYGKLSVASFGALDQPQYSQELSCDRVHFSGARGVCLAADRGVFTKYYAVMFDSDLKPGWRIPLNGIPSRTRVSPSGRLAAITIFLSGHSYVSLNFSTQTIIVDSATGHILADLETFVVTRDGLPFQSPDFNFWGVTFANDENQIYATLWSKGKTYLVKCKLREHSAEVIYSGVECPSLSPDNTRIAFKKREESSRVAWRISVLDLMTMTATPTGETRSVDDQVEWLDNSHLLYSLSESETGSSASTDVWEVPTGVAGTPNIFLKGAFSPAVASII